MKLRIALLLLFLAYFGSCHTSNIEENFQTNLTATLKQFIPDKRVQLFEIKLEKKKNTVYLRGESTNAEATQYLLSLLAKDYPLNQIHNEVRQLPDTAVGMYTWALVKQSVVPMRAKQGDANEMVSQAIMGTPIRLLDRCGDWYLVQSPDGYLSYMENTVLQPLTEQEFKSWRSSKERYIFTAVNGWAYTEADSKSQVVCDLVEGCIFQAKSYNTHFLRILLPDGRIAYVKKQDCVSFSSWGNQKLDDINARNVIADAKRLMGVPYLWGGISTKGIDCSGFTKLVFQSQGILLERDASQQQKYGKQIDVTNLSNFRPGDLLFFGKTPKATHVGIYIGNTRFIHASGMVKISSLDPTKPDYSEKRDKTLISACRILQSEEGLCVTTIKKCGWYVDYPQFINK